MQFWPGRSLRPTDRTWPPGEPVPHEWQNVSRDGQSSCDGSRYVPVMLEVMFAANPYAHLHICISAYLWIDLGWQRVSSCRQRCLDDDLPSTLTWYHFSVRRYGVLTPGGTLFVMKESLYPQRL
jgi:hypothetical protein